MYLYNCLNNISDVGLDLFSHDYKETDASDDADVILVRSAKMHEMEFSDKLVAIVEDFATALVDLRERLGGEHLSGSPEEVAESLGMEGFIRL